MVERIEDLNLPNTVVTRLIKESLPPGTAVSKEARAAIGRAASVFVIFLTSTSTSLAHKQFHKTITAANILDALKQLEFDDFIEPLKADLEEYRKVVKNKKESKAIKKAESEAATTSATEKMPDEEPAVTENKEK